MAGALDLVGRTVGGVVRGIGGIGGGVLEHIGTGLKGVRDAERARLAQPAQSLEESKARTGYYKQREASGGRASIDRLLTIIRNLGNDASPEFLDSALTFILEQDPGLAALYQETQGTDIIGSRKGTITETEKMRIFRNSLLNDDGTVAPENKELYDDISTTYKNMLNGLNMRYGGGKDKPKEASGRVDPTDQPVPPLYVPKKMPKGGAFGEIDPVDKAIKAASGLKTLPKARPPLRKMGTEYNPKTGHIEAGWYPKTPGAALSNIKPYGPQEAPPGYKAPQVTTTPPARPTKAFDAESFLGGIPSISLPTIADPSEPLTGIVFPEKPAGQVSRRITKMPDTPKSGDPAEIEAYRTLKKIWGRLDRKTAEKIKVLRSSGVPYDKILGADELQQYLGR